MVTHDLIKKIKNGMYDETLKDIYVDEKKIAYERERYIKAIESYTEHFGEGEVKLVGIIQIINVERCWQLPLTMMQ